jgi:hypothetical protein
LIYIVILNINYLRSFLPLLFLVCYAVFKEL